MHLNIIFRFFSACFRAVVCEAAFTALSGHGKTNTVRREVLKPVQVQSHGVKHASKPNFIVSLTLIVQGKLS